LKFLAPDEGYIFRLKHKEETIQTGEQLRIEKLEVCGVLTTYRAID
jgi:hypothetical protein